MTASRPASRSALPTAVLAVLAAVGLALTAAPAAAQIQRHPTGVNVNAFGATSVLITFGNLDGMVPVEATWCGELVDAAPAIGQRCAPGTIFGNLPIRYNQVRPAGQDGIVDVMSIPPSVARRAYQAAERGENSAFFYVRRFVDPDGLRPDEFVSVTCRLAGGGARVPFSLLDVRLEFDTEDTVLSLEKAGGMPPLEAKITYNGTGRLVGRWEVVLPGEEPPTNQDLLTEATLPPELRGTQRRYTELERFNVFLPPTGEFTLEGPDPATLPTHMKGLYQVLLRIEASDDKEGDTSFAAAGAGEGLLHTGAVAGFPIPPLRYYVGSGGRLGLVTGSLRLVQPEPNQVMELTEPLIFSWTQVTAATLYRVEFRDAADEEVLAALRQPGVASYRAPEWLRERVGAEPFTWRVLALDPEGETLAATDWRTAVIGPAAEGELEREPDHLHGDGGRSPAERGVHDPPRAPAEAL